MPRRVEGQRKIIKDGEGHMVMNRVDAPQHGKDVLFRIVRDLILPGVHDLQTVIQKNPRQIRGHERHIDGSVRIGPADDRKRSDVIHMRVADEDGIHAALLLDRTKVRQRILCCRLPYSAVQKKLPAGKSDVYAASANFHGSAGKI